MEKVIVITGADNGIGFNMTKCLLEQGYRVAALDIVQENLNQFKEIYPSQLMVFKCDITKTENVQQTVSAIVEKWSRIDILVNNACLAIFNSFENKPIEETRREFEVNYFGCLNMIQAVLPVMKAQQTGIIHNLSSGVGISGFPGIYGYASTKGAIESLTRTLSLEFSPYGICINLMHPPLTNTQSAAPLGIPTQVMEDPEKVGFQLAKKIFSTKPVISPNFQTSLYLFFVYRYPLALGKLFAKLTEKAKNPS